MSSEFQTFEYNFSTPTTEMLTRTPLRRVFANSFTSLIGAPKFQLKQNATLLSRINYVQSSIIKRPDVLFNQFNHQSIRYFSTLPTTQNHNLCEPTTIVTSSDQMFDILTKGKFFESKDYDFIVSIFEDEDNQEVFNQVKSHPDIKEFFADYLFKLCDYEHKGSFRFETFHHVMLKLKKIDKEFAELEFKVFDKDRSGTLSKSEVTRISKRILIYLIYRQIALTFAKPDTLVTKINVIRNYYVTLRESLAIFDKEETQNHCFDSLKQSIGSKKPQDEITFDEFQQFSNLKKFHNLDYILDIIDTTSDPDLYFCYTIEMFQARLDTLKFFEQTFHRHYELFIESFPIFLGKVKPTKDQVISYFTNYLFITFSNQQNLFHLMYEDVDKYVDVVKTLTTKESIVKFYFKNYSSGGLATPDGIKRFLTDIVLFRSLNVDDFDFDPKQIDEQRIFDIAKKCVESEKIELKEFESLIQSEKFVPFCLFDHSLQ
jgi:Ca2+-binding EF-hand superfamily protein